MESIKPQIKSTFDKMFEVASHILPVIGAFFAPALWVMLLVFLLVLVDTYTGVRAAKKEDRSTNRFSDIFAKLIGYGVFLAIGLILNKITGWEYCVWVASIVPIMTEISSIDENQKKVGKKGIFKQLEEAYKFALKIKHKRNELRK